MICEAKFLGKNDKINVDAKVIYYFFTYYQWEKVKDLDKEDKKRKNTIRILNFKKGEETDFGYFYTCLKSQFSAFEGTDWVAISVPSHDQTSNRKNHMDRFLERISLPKNIKSESGIILRSKPMLEKHGGNYGERTIEKDLDSFTGNTRNIIDRNFIIFDDITTSGSSLEAARQFLKKRGANKIVCIAFGKTNDERGGYYDFPF